MFVLLTLGGGGVGRLASLLLEYLERERFEPCIALLEHRGRYPLPLDIPIACFHKKVAMTFPGSYGGWLELMTKKSRMWF